jgi:hypothetical protein
MFRQVVACGEAVRCKEQHRRRSAVIEVVTAAVKRHIVHLVLGRIDGYVEMAGGEGATEIVVVASQIEAPWGGVAGRHHGPVIVTPNE